MNKLQYEKGDIVYNLKQGYIGEIIEIIGRAYMVKVTDQHHSNVPVGSNMSVDYLDVARVVRVSEGE